MFDFFHGIIAKIAIGISTVALFFSGASATPQPTQQTTQSATSSAQVEIVATSSATITATKNIETNTPPVAPKDNKNSLINSLKKQVADLTQKVSQPKVEAPKTSVITLPSGAIVEMDESGNIVRTITAAPQQTYTATTPTTQTQTSVAIQISNINTKISISSARIEWSTNIPTESKLFLIDPDGTPHVYNSLSGLSTSHFVNMTLAEGLTFSYEIEAIAQGVSVKKSGAFKMDKRIPTTITLKDGNPTGAYGGNCGSVSFKVGVKDQFGNSMIGESVSFFNPETNQFTARKTTESSDGIWATFTYTPQAFNTTKTMNFYIGDPPISPSISTSLTFNIGSSIIDAQPGNFFEDSPTQWRIKTTGGTIDPTTGMCN